MKTRQEAKEYQERTGLSLYRISKQSQVSYPTVYSYFKSDKPYSSETERKILNYLNAVAL